MNELEIEQKIVTLPIDDQMEAKLQEYAKDGWVLPPGVKPIATYQLIKAKQTMPNLKLVIDDEKIGILRNGKLI